MKRMFVAVIIAVCAAWGLSAAQQPAQCAGDCSVFIDGTTGSLTLRDVTLPFRTDSERRFRLTVNNRTDVALEVLLNNFQVYTTDRKAKQPKCPFGLTKPSASGTSAAAAAAKCELRSVSIPTNGQFSFSLMASNGTHGETYKFDLVATAPNAAPKVFDPELIIDNPAGVRVKPAR